MSESNELLETCPRVRVDKNTEGSAIDPSVLELRIRELETGVISVLLLISRLDPVSVEGRILD